MRVNIVIISAAVCRSMSPRQFLGFGIFNRSIRAILFFGDDDVFVDLRCQVQQLSFRTRLSRHPFWLSSIADHSHVYGCWARECAQWTVQIPPGWPLTISRIGGNDVVGVMIIDKAGEVMGGSRPNMHVGHYWQWQQKEMSVTCRWLIYYRLIKEGRIRLLAHTNMGNCTAGLSPPLLISIGDYCYGEKEIFWLRCSRTTLQDAFQISRVLAKLPREKNHDISRLWKFQWPQGRCSKTGHRLGRE